MYPLNWPLARYFGRLGVPLVIKIEVQFDETEKVYIATSPAVKGLVVEADSLHAVCEELEHLLPEMLRLKNNSENEFPHAYLSISSAFHPA